MRGTEPPNLRSRRTTVAALAVGAATTMATLGAARCSGSQAVLPVGPTHPPLVGEPRVWVVDDGHRVASWSGRMPAMNGEDNAIWAPGEPVRLFGLPGETIALQVVVSAGDRPLEHVTVDLPPLVDGVRIERFVVHELAMSRRSGGRHGGESLGWEDGAAPPGPAPNSTLPDPLIPVAHAPEWASYPMSVLPGRHRVVWIDLELNGRLPAGRYQSDIAVRSAGRELDALPLELEVGSTPLPYRALRTMLFFEPDDVRARVGSDSAVDAAFQLVHRHHISSIFSIDDAETVHTYRAALDGSLFTAERGYRGPGEGVGSDIVVVGAYGGLDDPTAANLARARAIVEALADIGIEDNPPERDVFLYAVDEKCDSPLGPAWRRALDEAASPLLRRLRVGHTCSLPPASQPVDVVMMHGGAYRPALAAAGREAGKAVWIYNGMLPRTGAFLTDSLPLSLRANAWIQAHHGIERWFYWESTFWDDDNRGGHGPYDPLLRAETFHNEDGDHCNGDGVLIYPGRQRREGWRDLGFDGVAPSIRLKQWRRGIQDAGYLALARAADSEAAVRIAAALVGDSFAATGAPSWPNASAPWFSARRKLFDIIEGRLTQRGARDR